MKPVELPITFIIMAFRYALRRNTGAPGEVAVQIKRYWNDLCYDFQRQIKEDIEREIKFMPENASWHEKVSDDLIDLLNWINKQ